MPDPATLLVFALAALALIAVPGPNLIFIATRSIAQGRRAGLVSVLGVETGTLLHVGAAAAGLSALLASSAAAFGFVKYAGAAYLVFLGVRTLMAGDPGEQEEQDRVAAGASLGRTYRQALVVQLLNPKVALFFLAFMPQFVDPARGSAATQVLVLGAVMASLGICVSSLYAVAAGAVGRRLRARGGFARGQRRLTGAVYLGLGAAAALSGGRD